MATASHLCHLLLVVMTAIPLILLLTLARATGDLLQEQQQGGLTDVVSTTADDDSSTTLRPDDDVMHHLHVSASAERRRRRREVCRDRKKRCKKMEGTCLTKETNCKGNKVKGCGRGCSCCLSIPTADQCTEKGGFCARTGDHCNGKISSLYNSCHDHCACCVPDKRATDQCTEKGGFCATTDNPCNGIISILQTSCDDQCICCVPDKQEPPTELFHISGTVVNFTFVNKCTQDLWIGAQGRSKSNPSAVPPNNGGWHLPINATSVVSVPYDFEAGRFWARTKCTGTPNVDFHCETGDCGHWIECATGNIARGGKPPATLAEFTLNKNNQDYFDISLVDGFNLPMTINVVTYDDSQHNPDEYWCTSPKCQFDINSICPPELAVNGTDGTVVACNSACVAFNTNQYCCRPPCCGLPTNCKPTTWEHNYANETFKSHCPQAYSYAYDDHTSTFFCRNTNYDIIFC